MEVYAFDLRVAQDILACLGEIIFNDITAPIDPISFLCKQWLQHGVLLHVRVSISSANEHVSISSTNDFDLLVREEF